MNNALQTGNDYFSGHAGQYAAFRPTYPEPLFKHLLSLVGSRRVAWDCGTGNGQVAYRLANEFDMVYATDISKEQLSHAPQHPRISYQLAPSELTSLPPKVCSLITAAAAIHWFRRDEFFREVSRVAEQGCLVAIWAYDRVLVNDEIDPLVSRLYRDIVGPYWPAERYHVERRYEEIHLPFEPINAPEFIIEQHWSADQFLGYLGTWSSVQLFKNAHHRDPVEDIAPAVRRAWIPETLVVRWPIFMKMGRVN